MLQLKLWGVARWQKAHCSIESQTGGQCKGHSKGGHARAIPRGPIPRAIPRGAIPRAIPRGSMQGPLQGGTYKGHSKKGHARAIASGAMQGPFQGGPCKGHSKGGHARAIARVTKEIKPRDCTSGGRMFTVLTQARKGTQEVTKEVSSGHIRLHKW